MMNQMIKKSFQILAIGAFASATLISSSSFAQKINCKSETLTYLDNAVLHLSAQMPASNILSQVVFQLGSNSSSALKIQGPVTGVLSRSQKMPDMNRFDISDSKSDRIDLFLPIAPSAPSFKGRIKVSFDGGYPLEKAMLCTFVQN